MANEVDPRLQGNIYTGSSTTGVVLKIRKKRVGTVVSDYIMSLYASLKSRFEYVNSKPNLMCATFLDPRYKELPFEEYMDYQAIERVSEHVINRVLKHYDDEKNDEESELVILPPNTPASGKKVCNSKL